MTEYDNDTYAPVSCDMKAHIDALRADSSDDEIKSVRMRSVKEDKLYNLLRNPEETGTNPLEESPNDILFEKICSLSDAVLNAMLEVVMYERKKTSKFGHFTVAFNPPKGARKYAAR